jgi:circadian clock protein KaiB
MPARIPSDAPQEPVVLKLYVSGGSTIAERAISNLEALCEAELEGRCRVEVIDIRARPEEAVTARILATPTLIKERPAPLRRLIGDLADHRQVLAGLDLEPWPRHEQQE